MMVKHENINACFSERFKYFTVISAAVHDDESIAPPAYDFVENADIEAVAVNISARDKVLDLNGFAAENLHSENSRTNAVSVVVSIN